MRLPTVIITFPGPSFEPGIQDIFLYLRPETNGVLVESMLLRVIKGNSVYCNKCKIAYLANIPGDFIVKKRIVQQHYGIKIRFARLGKRAFTGSMQKKFTEHFKIPFKDAPIIGSFAALKRFKMPYEDLFKIWVPSENFAVINGQSIKLYQDYFIVNYDIPALLHKNSRKTDIAVMICRSSLSKEEYSALVAEMGKSLVAEKVVAEDRPLARTFHYSSGPFEQILDGIGYLYGNDGSHLHLSSISFMAYLLKHGFSQKQILSAVYNPIMRFRTAEGDYLEENIYSLTKNSTYEEAMGIFSRRLP
jgi:hypothetical protein